MAPFGEAVPFAANRKRSTLPPPRWATNSSPRQNFAQWGPLKSGDVTVPLGAGTPSGFRKRVMEPAPGDRPSPRLLTNSSPAGLNATQHGMSKLASAIVASSVGL